MSDTTDKPTKKAAKKSAEPKKVKRTGVVLKSPDPPAPDDEQDGPIDDMRPIKPRLRVDWEVLHRWGEKKDKVPSNPTEACAMLKGK